MAAKKINWHQVDKKLFPGVRYYKHEIRKHGVKFDQYFSGSYQVKGKRKFIGFGWASESWTPTKVLEKINEYKHNMKTGDGPTSLKEEIALKEAAEKEKNKLSRKKKKALTTLKEYFDQTYYPMIQKQKKPQTHIREKSLFDNWIASSLGEKVFKNITKADVESVFYDIVDSGKSIRTGEYALTTLKQIWREAREGGFAPEMPTVSKAMKKKISQNNNARIRFLSHAEAEKLLAALKKVSVPLYEKTLVSLHCGMRASEIFNLKWSHVDLEHGILNIIDSKGADRSVNMTTSVLDMMKAKKQGKLNDLVFPGRQGKPSGQISQKFREVVNNLFNKDITDRRQRVTFHTCRHTCASWMVKQGVSLYLVQKVLGHSTIQVTERYAHLAPDQLQLAANAIDRAVAEQKDEKIVPFKKKA